LSPDELIEWATSVTGLSDFGADDFSDGLAVLASSFAAEGGLTERGSRAARAMLRGALVARLVSEAGFAALPAVPEISRPLIVTGLPRTGTTFMHRLLVADPRHQGLELWIANAPQPRPPRAEWAAQPAYQAVAAGVARKGLLPHQLGPEQVEECWQLLNQSMRSVSFGCLAHVPSYMSWLSSQDWLPAYQRHRRNLQLIGSNDADRRWVLKNPSHLFALDALLAVYPDALIVVTHRDPVISVASMCSLAARASSGWSTVFTGPVIGRTQLDLWADGLAAFTAARARYDPAQFCDVAYDDLVADPLTVVSRVYAQFGLTLTPSAADAMRELSGSAGDSSHRYSLADYGLTETDVLDRIPVAAAR
jgi:hypothetical protein